MSRRMAGAPGGPVPARFWDPESGGAVRCALCPHRCRIAAGGAGRCRARRNEGGTLLAATYGLLTSVALDPIEKKPLYHFHPGTEILSVGSLGCNLTCDFCQNHGISQESAPARHHAPEEIAALARDSGSVGIAFTYNEPTIAIEWMLDTAALVRAAGGAVALVTNGFVEPDPLAAILPLADAFNIDLKGFTEEFYARVCGGSLAPVLETIRRVHAAGRHLEVTTLLVPGLNDDDATVEGIAAFLAGLSPAIPLHLSRYHPDWRCDRPATPAATVLAACDRAGKFLRHVYPGNLRDPERSATRCAGCGARLIERDRLPVRVALDPAGRCPACKIPLAGRFAR